MFSCGQGGVGPSQARLSKQRKGLVGKPMLLFQLRLSTAMPKIYVGDGNSITSAALVHATFEVGLAEMAKGYTFNR